MQESPAGSIDPVGLSGCRSEVQPGLQSAKKFPATRREIDPGPIRKNVECRNES
jgi:hypothetical protein